MISLTPRQKARIKLLVESARAHSKKAEEIAEEAKDILICRVRKKA